MHFFFDRSRFLRLIFQPLQCTQCFLSLCLSPSPNVQFPGRFVHDLHFSFFFFFNFFSSLSPASSPFHLLSLALPPSSFAVSLPLPSPPFFLLLPRSPLSLCDLPLLLPSPFRVSPPPLLPFAPPQPPSPFVASR